MNKKIVSVIIFASLFCLASFASAQGITPPAGVPTTFPALFTQIADKVGGLIAGLGAIMIIIAGILYLTSAGSPERIGTAKKALIYAIVGIVIGLGAKGIVEMVKSFV